MDIEAVLRVVQHCITLVATMSCIQLMTVLLSLGLTVGKPIQYPESFHSYTLSSIGYFHKELHMYLYHTMYNLVTAMIMLQEQLHQM